MVAFTLQSFVSVIFKGAMQKKISSFQQQKNARILHKKRL